MVSATTSGRSPKPCSRSAASGSDVAAMIACACFSASSRVSSPSSLPRVAAAAELDVASASNPSPAITHAEAPSHTLGMTNAPGRWWSARKRCAFSACVSLTADPPLGNTRPMRGCMLLALLLTLPAVAQPDCTRSATAAAAREHLARTMAHGRFVTYEPTSLRVIDGHFSAADPDSIRADLKVLRPDFDGLITYDAVHGAQAIPAIAAQLKFRALIIGVWDPADRAQLDAALA